MVNVIIAQTLYSHVPKERPRTFIWHLKKFSYSFPYFYQKFHRTLIPSHTLLKMLASFSWGSLFTLWNSMPVLWLPPILFPNFQPYSHSFLYSSQKFNRTLFRPCFSSSAREYVNRRVPAEQAWKKTFFLCNVGLSLHKNLFFKHRRSFYSKCHM